MANNVNTSVQNKEPLTKKELNRLFRRFAFNYTRCGNYENWHGTAYGWAIIPLFEKYYGKDSKEFSDAVKRHLDFHNNEPVTASLIQGIMIGMEEEKAMGKEVDSELIHSTKSSLMGPCAGIGDSLVQATLVPLLLSIAISLTGSGEPYSVLGPIFYLVSVAIILVAYGRTLFFKGYSLGKDAIKLLVGEKVKNIREAIQIFGVLLVGALSANYCKPKLALEFVAAPGADPTSIQGIIDGIFPNLLGLGLVLLCYWLLTKKKCSILKLISILMVAVIVLTYLHIL